MKIISFFAVAGFGLALSGCSNAYLERKDTVTFAAGDAVAWDAAQQIPDPWPKGVNNTRIIESGEKEARAVKRYIETPGGLSGGGAPQAGMSGGGAAPSSQ